MKQVELKGYKLIPQGKSSSSKGGLIIYLHEKFEHDYKLKISKYSFYPKITLPTRISNKHGTLIDNFLCKLTEATLDTTSGILIKKFSDHQPYFIILKNINHKDHKPKYIKIEKQDTESIQNLQTEIQNALDQANLDGDLGSDPNINYSTLHEIIHKAKLKHMPVKLVKFVKHKHKISPWITRGILKSIQYRDKLYKNHKMTNPNTTEYRKLT